MGKKIQKRAKTEAELRAQIRSLKAQLEAARPNRYGSCNICTYIYKDKDEDCPNCVLFGTMEGGG